MIRRSFLSLLTAVLMSPALAPAANADAAYPSRPIRIVLGFPAGSATDIITRIYAEEIGKNLNGSLVVENQPGAAGNIASAAVARAAPDGYTLLMATTANATSVNLYKNLGYDFRKDFEPVALLASAPPVISVAANSPIRSIADLIKLAKSKPGEVTFGSSGVGTAPHMSAELLNMMAGIKMTHIPYKGTNDAVTDLVTGRLMVLFSPLPTVSSLAADNKLRILAVTTKQRSTLAPDLPTVAESGVPDFDATLWFGLVAPKGTPPAILAKLSAAVEKAAQNPDLKGRLRSSGGEPMLVAGNAFGAFIDSNIETWAKVIAFAGLERR
jgi:tripartite-type tricarboxylate transporter receptor subunit TctC